MSSSKNVPPWQNVLDSLTCKAQEWNLIKDFDRKDEFQIAQKCLQHETLRSYLNEWMELCLSNGPKKSKADSVAFRTKGNDEFKRHRDFASLSLYTDCIRYAPYGSEELALGLANRSAVLYHMKKYRECVRDAEIALKLPYPENLRLKLMLRQARSYLQLEEWKLCLTTLEIAESNISASALNTEGFVKGIKQDILSVRSELNELQKKSGNNLTEKTSENMTPPLLNGPNSEFPHASAALELRYSCHKGRYVVTNQDVKQGDVLFVEKPYAFVVLPDQNKVHCHNCSRSLIAPLPCRHCADVLFCCEKCEMDAHESYHHWECGGMSLMSAIGVAHLGLRIVLTTGSLNQILNHALELSQNIQCDKTLDHFYSGVYSLVPHIQDMPLDDVFQYAVTAELLTLFLVHKSDYFKHTEQLMLPKNEVVAKICALLLRHIAQLVCNAHAITKLDSEKKQADFPGDSLNTVMSESQQRIATAIYPSASMMNHSCDPNIINSFLDEILIVKASRNIPKGDEVFNCYGPHFQRMATAERRAALQAQYFFFCDCSACTASPEESFDPVQERLWALRCAACEGPLLNEVPGREPAGSKAAQNDTSNSHVMVCDSCGVHQPISNLVHDAFSALSLFKKGCEKMEEGHMQDALNHLNHCRELQERALYHSNKDLTATYDTLAKCYATLGDYCRSVQLLELTLPAIEEQFGANSVEVAHELQKLSDVMLCNIRTMETVPSRDVLENAQKVVKRALSILSVHYGRWNQGWQDLEKKLQELKLMDEMACVQDNFRSKINL